MPKRCPPGVLCIENITILFIFVLLVAIFLFIQTRSLKNIQQSSQPQEIIIKEQNDFPNFFASSTLTRPAFTFTNRAHDVLLNPYEAPLRDDRIFRTDMSDPRGIPINIQTRAVDTTYRQVGILTRMGSQEMILPLMGRPLHTSRDKWNFYTMSNENSMVKLPITYKNKSCTDEYGCDNLYNGDVVYVQGYNDTFKVTVYDNQVMRYIPYL